MNIVDRAKNMVLQPKSEWAVIEPEPSDPKSLYLNYVVILAILPAAGSFLSLMLFPGPMGVRFGMGTVLGVALTQYVLSLVMVFVIATIADLLAPSFDGQRNLNQALKLTAYAMTAAWVAGVFVILPIVGWLISVIGSLYSLYVFFLGVPALMKVPEQKAVRYTVVVVIAAIVIGVVIAAINASMLGTGTMRGM